MMGRLNQSRRHERPAGAPNWCNFEAFSEWLHGVRLQFPEGSRQWNFYHCHIEDCGVQRSHSVHGSDPTERLVEDMVSTLACHTDPVVNRSRTTLASLSPPHWWKKRMRTGSCWVDDNAQKEGLC